MREQTPVVEFLLVPEAEGVRLYVAGWCPPLIRTRPDPARSVHIGRVPDLGDLDSYMWNADAPFRRRASGVNVEVEARGRSAIVVGEWVACLF